LHKGEALLRHLDGGGELKRMLKPAVQREAEPLLAQASIDGVPVSDRGALRVVVEHLRVHVLADQLADAWAGVGVRFDRAAPLARRVERRHLASRAPQAPPELAALATALAARDADGYATQLAALADAHLERAAQQRCDLLLDRLRGGHPGLAELLVRTTDDP